MVKFVIWGNGRLGCDVYAILGKERVVAFVEGNFSLWGKEYNGAPIISFEQYIHDYAQYPIIVTPNDYESEISNLLENNGIKNYFLNSFHMRYMVSFLLQIDKKEFLQEFPKEATIVVYGYTIVGILLYEYFIKKGYDCLLAIGKEQKGLESYIDKTLCINVDELQDVITMGKNYILTKKLDIEISKKLESTGKVLDFLQIERKEELFEHKELQKFKDIHKGKRCFIIGTGSTLTMEDLDKLHKNHEICISMNGIFKAFPITRWRPDYYIVSDPAAVIQWKKEILEMDVKEKFIADWAFFFDRDVSNFHKYHKNVEWDEKSLPLFSGDFSKTVYYGATVAYKAIQLAVYMGIKEIYLLGVDCSWKPGEKNHFIDDYEGKEYKSTKLYPHKNILAYQSAQKYAKDHGIRIYNATRGGELEVFQRVDFDVLF